MSAESITWLPWITYHEFISGITTELIGIIIDVVITVGVLEVLRKNREKKRYEAVRLGSRRILCQYAIEIGDLLEEGLLHLREIENSSPQELCEPKHDHAFLEIKEKSLQLSRDIVDRYHVLDPATIALGEYIFSLSESLLRIWSVKFVISATRRGAWTLRHKNVLARAIPEEKGEIEDLRDLFGSVGSLSDEVLARRFTFGQASIRIMTKIDEMKRNPELFVNARRMAISFALLDEAKNAT